MRNKLLVSSGLVGALVALMSATAGAQEVTPSNPLDGAADEVLGNATSWVTSEGVPYIIGFLMLSVLVTFGVRFLRRHAK